MVITKMCVFIAVYSLFSQNNIRNKLHKSRQARPKDLDESTIPSIYSSIKQYAIAKSVTPEPSEYTNHLPSSLYKVDIEP